MVRCGLIVPRNAATRFRWIGCCLQMKLSPKWRCWQPKNAKLRCRVRPLEEMEWPRIQSMSTTASHHDCATLRRISHTIPNAVPCDSCGPEPWAGPRNAATHALCDMRRDTSQTDHP